MPPNFWSNLATPFFVLAPMSGVTDAALRRMLARHGKPDVLCTGFVAADGLCSPGRATLLHELSLSAEQLPLVAQVYGANPDTLHAAARLLAERGFSGMDINMGCPARAIEKRQAGAVLMQTPRLAQQLVLAAKAGAGQMPVSVKTRCGYRGGSSEHWLGSLLEVQPAALSIHARTREESYSVPARWEAVVQAVAMARQAQPDPVARTLIIGNGDVRNLRQARQRAAACGCDGVMIGRPVLGNPWLFNERLSRETLDPREIVAAMLEHVALFIEHSAGGKPLEMLKKHLKAYAQGFAGAAELRACLMGTSDADRWRLLAADFCAALPRTGAAS